MVLKLILINRINILKIKIILQNLYQMQISKYLIIYVLFNLIFTPKVISQEIKTYKGIYKNGNAEYQYYENKDYERVLNGSYKFSRKIDENYYGKYFILLTENGSFKNGKKDGEWFFTIETFLKNTKEVNLTIKGKFSDDLKIETWKQVRNNKSFTLIFTNDTIVGKFNVSGQCGDTGSNNGRKCIIEGNFSNKGNWDGEFKLVEPDREIIALFKDNLLVKLIDKKPSTGEIYSKYSPDIDLLNFQQSIKEYNIVPFIYGKYEQNKKNFENSPGFSLISDKQKEYILNVDYSLSYFMESLFHNYWPTDRRVEYFPEFKELNEKLIINDPDILIVK
jgi:hypothetical protein